MKWTIREKSRASKAGLSKYGSCNSTNRLPGILGKLYEQTSYSSNNLDQFALDNGFQWQGTDGTDVSASIDPTRPLEAIVDDPRAGFAAGLLDVLNDIAHVVVKLGVERPTTDAPWKLLIAEQIHVAIAEDEPYVAVTDGGFLAVYFTLPGPNGTVNSPCYRRADFILYRGSERTGKPFACFYHWAMEYMTAAGKLGVGGKIKGEDVKTVKRVHQNVWILEGSNPGDKVVIKVEKKLGSLSFKKYHCQHECIAFLSEQMFVSVPRIVPLDRAELQYIETIPVDAEVPSTKELGEGNPGLAALAKNSEKDGFVLFKMPHLEMGYNLMNLIEKNAGGKRTRALREFLFDAGKMRTLGRIAVFDLLVNNRDRFPPIAGKLSGQSVNVNVQNIDFDTAGQIVALDNVDPYNPISFDQWPGGATLTERAGLIRYANLAVTDLIAKTGAVDYYEPDAHWEGLDLKVMSPWDSGVPTSVKGFELGLMPWGDGTEVPTSGKNLVIVGTDPRKKLHIGIFDAFGRVVTNTDETKLQSPARKWAAECLNDLLDGWCRDNHVPTGAEQAHVIREATSIVGRSLALAIVGLGSDKKNLLHIRIFDAVGELVTDTDETKLRGKAAGAISTLKEQLRGKVEPNMKEKYIHGVKSIIKEVALTDKHALQQAFHEGMQGGVSTLKALGWIMKETGAAGTLIPKYLPELYKLMFGRIARMRSQ